MLTPSFQCYMHYHSGTSPFEIMAFLDGSLHIGPEV